jgi:hypothetical protein
MSIKRARTQEDEFDNMSDVTCSDAGSEPSVDLPNEQEDDVRSNTDNVNAFYKYLTDRFIEARPWNAIDVTTIAFYATQCGATGLEHLALPPTEAASKYASAKVYGCLKKTFPEPEVQQVTVPTYNRRTCIRSETSVPCRLPHMMDLAVPVSDTSEIDPLIESEHLNQDSFIQHDVVRANRGLQWQQVRPVSLFFDGVAFSKRDSFFGFYVRCLRTNVEEVCFIIRPSDVTSESFYFVTVLYRV